jgi:hypothetical protein
MSTIPEGSVCDKCGGGLGLNEEGRVICQGCSKTTDMCSCAEAGEGAGPAAATAGG